MKKAKFNSWNAYVAWTWFLFKNPQDKLALVFMILGDVRFAALE